MPSLLVVVFIIQLAIHLVNSIGAKTLNEILWNLYIRIPLNTSSDMKEQLRLRQEVVRLKREMNAISAQDDFARWAKLRREHDKLMAKHDEKASSVSSARSSFDTKASMLRWISTTGLRFALQFWHAKTPVFTYPRGWVPWYVEWTLGFPRCPSGGVSINVWSAACATVISLVADVVGYLVVNLQGQGQKQKQKGEPVKVGVGGEKTI